MPPLGAAVVVGPEPRLWVVIPLEGCKGFINSEMVIDWAFEVGKGSELRVGERLPSSVGLEKRSGGVRGTAVEVEAIGSAEVQYVEVGSVVIDASAGGSEVGSEAAGRCVYIKV